MNSVQELIKSFFITDFRNAETILLESVKDIDAGYWVCGTLFQQSTRTNYHSKHKPKGCAMGLVAINGGVAPIQEFKHIDGSVMWISDTDQSSEAEGWENPNARKALIALAMTIEGGVQPSETWDAYATIDEALRFDYVVNQAQDCVIEHNDSCCKGPRDAKEWFKRAAEYAAKNKF